MGWNSAGLVLPLSVPKERQLELLEALFGMPLRAFDENAPFISEGARAHVDTITDQNAQAVAKHMLERHRFDIRSWYDVMVCSVGGATHVVSSWLATRIILDPDGSAATTDDGPPAPDVAAIMAAAGVDSLTAWCHYDSSSTHGFALFEHGREVRRFLTDASDGVSVNTGNLASLDDALKPAALTVAERVRFALPLARGMLIVRNAESGELEPDYQAAPWVICKIMVERHGWSPYSYDYCPARLAPPAEWLNYRVI